MSGKLFCVGCGPGDSELLTLKAANIIRTADTIFCPTSRVGRDSMALSIVKSILNERNDSYEIINVIFPMVKDKTTLQKTWSDNTDQIAKKCKDGNNVVYITVGDPSLYSHLHTQRIKGKISIN